MTAVTTKATNVNRVVIVQVKATSDRLSVKKVPQRDGVILCWGGRSLQI
jgi:hypothetical protein